MKADGTNRRQQNIGATKDNVTQKKGKGYAPATSVSRPTVTSQPRRKQPDLTETITAVNVPGNHSKRDLYIGRWNVRTLRTAGHWDVLVEEARKFHVDLLGLCETHLTNTETLIDKDEFKVLLSSRADVGREGVGILISPKLHTTLPKEL